jgi:hypothetical protein
MIDRSLVVILGSAGGSPVLLLGVDSPTNQLFLGHFDSRSLSVCSLAVRIGGLFVRVVAAFL